MATLETYIKCGKNGCMELLETSLLDILQLQSEVVVNSSTVEERSYGRKFQGWLTGECLLMKQLMLFMGIMGLCLPHRLFPSCARTGRMERFPSTFDRGRLDDFVDEGFL